MARPVIIRHQTPSVTTLTRYRSDKQVRFAYQDDLVLDVLINFTIDIFQIYESVHIYIVVH